MPRLISVRLLNRLLDRRKRKKHFGNWCDHLGHRGNHFGHREHHVGEQLDDLQLVKLPSDTCRIQNQDRDQTTLVQKVDMGMR